MCTLRAAREREAVGMRVARAAERAMVVSMDIVNGGGEKDGGEGKELDSRKLEGEARRLIGVASTSSLRHVGLLRLADGLRPGNEPCRSCRARFSLSQFSVCSAP